MKIDRDKIVGLIFTLFLMITAPTFFYTHDTLRPTRDELIKFYLTEFNNDSITSIIMRKYPGKGYYNLFKVNTSSEYFPILLETLNSKDLFKIGASVTKDKNSYDLILNSGGDIYSLKVRNSKDEDDRMMGALLPIGFFGLFFLIQLFFIPNSFYENRRKNKTAHNKRS
jgi:hypothetical protein